MEEPQWKKIKLSLERPYKDDNGEPIPILLDITQDGEHVYEPKDDLSKSLGERLGRIFVERGFDFFEKSGGRVLNQDNLKELGSSAETVQAEDEKNEPEENQKATTGPMTPDELFKMRSQIVPQLHIALGEMSHAKELLSLLLSSASPGQLSSIPSLPPSALTATIISKPPPIPSVEAFNAQLSVGGKDELLRKAADVFKSAADSMERGRVRGEKYWVNALKIRRANWGLIPAPLPFGSAMGKGADKTSKDFFVSFGLEEAPLIYRRRAICHIATDETASGALVFPTRQHIRLRISLNTTEANGVQCFFRNTATPQGDSLDDLLRAAQQEVVEQEIFSVLVKEANNLPTASVRVSERLIVIEAAQGTELRFELVDEDSSESRLPSAKCDLIFFILHALLLRVHNHRRTQRIGTAGVVRAPGSGVSQPPPPILRPIIDLLQYQVFCERVKGEIDRIAMALSVAGVPSTLRFEFVGESGAEIVKFLDGDTTKRTGGEAVLRIDNRHSLRFTFLSPSSLTAHLPQATLTIASIPQLVQLLFDEVENCLLNRICEVGSELCDRVNGTWFVDLVTGRSVGRWEGCVINFRIFYGVDSSLCCSAFRLDRTSSRGTLLETYSLGTRLPLLSWAQHIIESALAKH